MELAQVIAERFIQRRDVKAVQFQSGAYVPDRELKNPSNHAPLGWYGRHILSHLEGKASYGHYLLDENSLCKLFAFDIDLEKIGSWVEYPDVEDISGVTNEEFEALTQIHPCNPRELWADRSAAQARNWFKYQMSTLAHKFCSVIRREMKLPCAAAYSGSKGIHVYAFTGSIPAEEARAGAQLVMEMLDEFELFRGQNFYRHKHGGEMGFPSFSVEIFPKQGTVKNEDGYGNLMRLPLGRNLKSQDPTFFLDLTAPIAKLQPHPDPVKLLNTGEPYL